jgi:drug/metabolite transporter (DMT)-like permease
MRPEARKERGEESWMLVKIFLVLAVALVVEAIGLVCLRKGMMQVGEISSFNIKALFAIFLQVVTNKMVVLGVFFSAIYFCLFLTLLSWGELSFILPLTAVGYLVSGSFARYFLMEQVSPLRWVGTLLIVVGVFLIMRSAQR